MSASAKTPNNVWTIKGLGADGPDLALADKLELFGQFVGDWDIEAKWFLPDGTIRQGTGELHVAWILNGRAIQDVWMSHQQNQSVAAGTTIRFYDPDLDAWHSIWISPSQGGLRSFVARKVGSEIVLEGTTKEGLPDRWIFSDITPQSFRWRAVESHDDQKTWQLTEEMWIKRVG